MLKIPVSVQESFQKNLVPQTQSYIHPQTLTASFRKPIHTPIWHASPSQPTRGQHMTPDDQGMGSVPYNHLPKWPPRLREQRDQGSCFQSVGVFPYYY